MKLIRLTLSSNAAIPIPDAAPVPANPIKCPEPILLANKDAPTFANQINRNDFLVIQHYFTRYMCKMALNCTPIYLPE